ncbi:MAG: hypothetical protein RLZZ505_592 [Verrucomicrobiota bacterium]|jgi:hypothetical protein
MRILKLSRIVHVFGSAAVLLLASCVSTKNAAISSEDKAMLSGKTVAVAQRKMPGWGVMKPEAVGVASLGGAIGGAIAGSVAESQGKVQLERHGIKDPAVGISENLMGVLGKKYGIKRAPSNGAVTTDLNPSKVAALYPNSDYVLDTFTTGWMGMYYPMTLTKYRVIYGSKMRLIETKSGRIVAEGFYNYQSDDKANAPNFEGIYSNGAAFLKRELKTCSDGATHVFKQQL